MRTHVRGVPVRASSRWLAACVSLAIAAVFTLPAAARPPQSPQNDFGHPVSAQESPQLFAVMCALYAAGFDADVATPGGDPVLIDLRARMLGMQGPAADALRKFYREHALADPGATMSRYVTFALVAGPPPKFGVSTSRPDLPPDVLTLDGFNEVLTNFYREAHLADLWQQFQPAYAEAVDSLRQPLGQVVLTEAGYLRELVKTGPRTFTVYVEPLVMGRTNVRNIGDRYAIVVSPESPPLGEIRHAFLHFLIDQMPLRYAEKVQATRPLLRVAAGAPQLPDELRDDLPAFFAECFVRTVELRLQRPAPAQLAAQLNDADAEGYVLERPLMAALVKFEAAAPAMSLYFPDLVASIDVAAELKRLPTVAFAPASQQEDAAAPKPSVEVGLDAALADGERLIAAHDAAGAQRMFESVLQKEPDQPRALYGLAVATVLQGNALRARDLFQQAVVSAEGTGGATAHPDPVALAWSHVYLGRMNDLDGNRDAALADYRAALAVDGAPEASRVAAQRGVEQGYQPATPSTSPKPQ